MLAAEVNELYLRRMGPTGVSWQDRAHFLAVSAQIMRRILIDFARARKYQKRGGEAQRIAFDEGLEVSVERGADLLALDEALDRLASLDARKSCVVDASAGPALGRRSS